MIQELIYTSVPKGLAADSQGFCVVSCSTGMAPNLERELVNLSGYRHPFLPGDERVALNPEAYFHIMRRVGGADIHVVSRVADCGLDYSRRTNKIAHHLALEKRDLLSCGPAAILSQKDLFLKEWVGPPRYVERPRELANFEVRPAKCIAWEKALGDAGWGGVFAQAAEAGRPISLIFEPGRKILPFLCEAFALLPPEKRWKITFSTFFMKSQEPGRDKVQIKGILLGSDEMAYARLSPQTLVVDFPKRQINGQLTGPYVEVARTGVSETAAVKLPTPPKRDPGKKTAQVPQASEEEPHGVEIPIGEDVYDLMNYVTSVPTANRQIQPPPRPKSRKGVPLWLVLVLIPLLIIGTIAATALFFLGGNQAPTTEIAQTQDSTTGDDSTEETKPEGEESNEQQPNEEEQEKPQDDETKTENVAKSEEPVKTKDETAAKLKEKLEAENLAAAKKKKEADQKILDDLPPYWEKIDENEPLKKSNALWKIKDRVTLKYIPFLPLETGKEPIKVRPKEPNHLIEFYQDASVTFSGKQETIASLELQKEGFVFEWKQPALETNEEQRRARNCILLSRLQISVGEIDSKEITLWEPFVGEPRNYELGGDSFALWKHGQPGFDVTIGDTLFVLEFPSKLSPSLGFSVSNTVQLRDGICYTPDFKIKTEEKPVDGFFSIKLEEEEGKDKKLKFQLQTEEILKLIKEIDNLSKQKKPIEDEKNRKEQEYKDKNVELKLNTINNELKKKAPLPPTRQDERRDPNVQGRYQQALRDYNRDMKNLEAQKQTGENIKESWRNEKKTLQDRIEGFDNQIRKIVETIKELRKTRLGEVPFSIYLLKSGTPEGEIGKAENRLLLLEVK